ncbi:MULTISPECIES: ATP-binding cassette domain-containing protein [unclassified Corynebacterium]|uniref:ATP-binding cassette domain-containing protein n=1 Tax=unclassified Corynebacterium TaxID=2624378 RepID=UPI001D0E8739|nr:MULTISPECIES: ATP-binding cassette domain-containing protein [unclassified Corynebacterium]
MQRLLHVSAAVLILLSFLVAFPLAHLLDSDLGSTGRQGFLIMESSGETSPTELRDELVHYAEDRRITVGLEHFETTAAGTTHHLYVAAGEDSSTMSTWLRTGYSGFDPSVTVSVSPLSEAPLTDAGGLYHVSGDKAEVRDLQQHVESLGFTASSLKLEWYYFLTDPVIVTVTAMLFLVATLTLSGVLLRARDYAIRRIHGQGFWNIIGRDLRDLLPTALVSLFASAALSALALYFYNGLRAVGLYLQCFAALGLLGGIVFFLSLLVAVGILHLVSLIPALGGKIPGAPVTIGTYALRLCALLVTISTVSQVVAAALEMDHQKTQREVWRAHGEAEAFYISTRTGDMHGDIAPALRAADERNEILLADVQLDNTANPELFLTNTLFAEQELSLPASERAQPGEALILIPEGTPPEHIDRAHQKILFEADYAGIPAPNIIEKPIPGDTKIFTYATSFGFTTPEATVSKIPIIVLPRSLETLADLNLVAPATQLRLFAANSEAMQKLIADPSAGPYIGGHFTALSHWEEAHTKAQNQFRFQSHQPGNPHPRGHRLRDRFRRRVSDPAPTAPHRHRPHGTLPLAGTRRPATHRGGIPTHSRGMVTAPPPRLQRSRAHRHTQRNTAHHGHHPRTRGHHPQHLPAVGRHLPFHVRPLRPHVLPHPRALRRTIMNHTITVSGLTKTFGPRTLWRGVEFTCPQGSITALTGPSGSGKSTLLNCIGTLDTADSGTIMAAGKNIQKLSSGKRRAFRKNNLGFLFQDYALIPDKSAEYNIRLATTNKQQKERIDSALETVGLSGYHKRVVHELSGGEQQRVALARILARQPEIILADEPTGALDPHNGHNVVEQLRDLANQGATVVIATHAPEVRDAADQHIDLSRFLDED